MSPQGDGLNDTFDISHFGGVSLQIFNRYGMKVYDKKNYKNEWHGQTNSSNTLLPNGTYFYHIVTNRGETLSGWGSVDVLGGEVCSLLGLFFW
ncbi:gliding motility-associated C-terminal domain-containing protein [Myroides odoratus]|uniref:T9SS type B sorting domain-containing protein n=1 Tax=Myroides odoratus TaxID=256 RepID=UPI0039AEF4D0